MLFKQLLDNSLVKAHLLNVILRQEGKIEDNSDQVALSAIVFVVVISINDVVLSIDKICSKVLEEL